jgi:hypothetical protein
VVREPAPNTFAADQPKVFTHLFQIQTALTVSLRVGSLVEG